MRTIWKLDPIYVERRQEWIEALLSGKYAQGKGKLRDRHNQFCCLGVGCDVSKLTKWKLPNYPYPDRYIYLNIGAVLPPRVEEYFGFSNGNPVVCGESLAVWNDSFSATFEEIALGILFEEEFQKDIQLSGVGI